MSDIINEIKQRKVVKDSMKFVNQILWPLDKLYYHQYSHALEVFDRSLYLWIKENLNLDELEILAIACLFHDTWYSIQYDDNEYIWAKIARNYLLSYNYDIEKIKKVERLIIVTIPIFPPSNIMEKIIKDADTDNLWRDDFFDKWNDLKSEIELIKNIKIKDPDWCHYSIDFIKNHSFYTKTWQIERDKRKNKNLDKLFNKLKDYNS